MIFYFFIPIFIVAATIALYSTLSVNNSSSSSYLLCRAPFTNKIYPQTHKRHKHHVHLTISPYNILLINCMLHSYSSPSYIHRLWALFLSVPFLSSSYKNHFLLLSLMLTTCLQFIDVKDTNAAG